MGKQLVMILSINKRIYRPGLWLVLFLSIFHVADAQEQKTFSSLEEVLRLAKEKSHTFYNADIQEKLADLTQKTALGNVLNPRIPAFGQALDNIQQQVIFMPGEIFGQPGTFRQITTGQRYSAIFNIQPQFEILNPASITQVRSAKINKELTSVQNSINEQQTYDQINAIYFNILSFQEQIDIVTQNIATADTILRVTQNRFEEGVGRKQDVNDAEVTLIHLQDNLEQLRLNLKIQEESLALFFENSITPVLTENIYAHEVAQQLFETNNTLQVQYATLQLKMMEQDIKVAKMQNLPTLSFVSSFSWQNLSNDGLFHSNSNWIDYSYVGLRLSIDFPTTVSKLSTIRNKQFQSELLKNNYKHSIKETETKNRQMILDYKKAVSQFQNLRKIAALKEDTYRKNFQQYEENILSLDRLLISYNDLLIAKLNLVSALASVGFNKSKVDINNKF